MHQLSADNMSFDVTICHLGMTSLNDVGLIKPTQFQHFIEAEPWHMICI